MKPIVTVLTLLAAAGAVDAQEAPSPIQDNSFLLEEAYNQETGVIQHISLFTRARGTGDWGYAFTQEWPLGGQRHQLSYTLMLERAAGTSGFGDAFLNYRYQVAGSGGDRVAAAPRVSILVPTGDETDGLGVGGWGLDVGFPLSVVIAGDVVTHVNVAAAVVPRARNAVGDRAATREVRVGQSLIWQVRPTVNLMVEAAWRRGETVTGPGTRASREEFFVSPGIRGAFNFASGLQVVPGAAVAFGVGPSRGARLVVLYLSFEHPLRRVTESGLGGRIFK
jgi:hypothetical protein